MSARKRPLSAQEQQAETTRVLRKARRKATSAPNATVTDFRALLDAVAGPDHAADAEQEHAEITECEQDEWRSQGPARTLQVYTDAHVRQAVVFLGRTGLERFFTSSIDASKTKPGRPRNVPVPAVLVALWLCASTGGASMLTLRMRDVLYHQISDVMRAELGVKAGPVPRALDARLDYDLAAVACVRRTLRTMLTHINPSPLPLGRRLSDHDLTARTRDLPAEQALALQAALDWVCNQMLEAAWQELPRRIRRQYTGAACIDATPLPVAVRPGDRHTNPADPDSGVYVRDGDHTDPADRSRYQRVNTVRFSAYDIHLIIACDDRPGLAQHLPSLPLALTLTRPGEDPAGSARRMFASAAQRQHKTGWLAGDALYFNQNPTQFQIPALEAKRQVILPYTDDQLGKQGAHASGAHMIEGWWYCPSMPDTLVDATKTLRAGTITPTEYRALIAQRLPYRLRVAENADSNGNERMRCPAAGTSPIAVCPFKADSAKERATAQKDGTKVDVRIEIRPPSRLTDEHGNIPKVCRQETVTIKQDDHAKYRQELQFGSEEYETLYHRMRQSQEGEHGRMKDQAYEALADKTKRRLRGRAAQSLLAAFVIAAAALRKIHTFLQKAEEPADRDAPVVVLKRDPASRRNTWLPTGTSEPPGQQHPLTA